MDDRPARGELTPGYKGPRVIIQRDGKPAPMTEDGNHNLYEPASRVFGQLDTQNCFTAVRNEFRGLVTMHRCHILSDPLLKANVRPLDENSAQDLVGSLQPLTYEVDGLPGSGFAADAVPDRYVSRDAEGGRPVAVDYHSLMVELWAAVRVLQKRVAVLEREQESAAPAP